MDATRRDELTQPAPRHPVVRLPDATIGTAHYRGTDVRVVHEDRDLGRGPWIFARTQVEPATADEVTAYEQRIAARAVR